MTDTEATAGVNEVLSSEVRAFLFADARGYTRFTHDRGDEAAARLADRFATLTREVVTAGGGEVIELAGDQAVAVFLSPRQALRTAVALQERFGVERASDPSQVLEIGIGLDAGEAVPVQGGYRSGALNLAARLCALAGPGEIFASEGIVHLARKVEGIVIVSRGAVHLKGLPDPVPVSQVGAEGTLPDGMPPLETPAPSLPMNNMPIQLTSFVGRVEEQTEVRALLAGEHLVTLSGTGGSGKTRLGLQVAGDLLERYADGVWVVELASVADSALVTQTVALSLGLREQPDRPLAEALVDFLVSKRLLLVLDNCEHLVTAVRELTASLLRTCPQLQILATSREVLGVPGEVTYRVPSLALPELDELATVGKIEETDAIRLFADRARARRTGFAVTEQNAQAVVEICTRLDGVPLAIELAAARVGVLPVSQLLSRLEDRFRVLTGGSGSAPPRQRTLRATLDWSYELLSQEEQVLLQRLSVFAGGCTLDAAEAVCACDPVEAGAVLDLVESLVNKSLLQMEEHGTEARYRLHETLRQYARERLEAAGETGETGTRHAEWYANLAQQAESGLLGSEQLWWLDRMELERDNLRAAVDWSLAHAERDPADADRGLQLASSQWRFWELRGPLSEGRRWLEQMVTVAGDADPALRARALTALGHLTAVQGEAEAAKTSAEEALRLWRTLPESPDRTAGEATSLLVLGEVALARAETEAASKRFGESLELGRELGNDWGIASTLEGLGRAALARTAVEGFAMRRGDWDQATQLFEESLQLRQQMGDVWGVSRAYIHLGSVEQDQEDYVRAREFYQRALGLARDLRDPLGMGESLFNLGIATILPGDAEGAEASLSASLTLFQQVGAASRAAAALHWLAEAALLRDEWDLTVERAQEAWALYTRLGQEDSRAFLHVPLATAAMFQCRYEEAATRLEEALTYTTAPSAAMFKTTATGILGVVRCRQGQLEMAAERFRESLELVRLLAGFYGLRFLARGMLGVEAQLVVARGQFELAARLLGAREAAARTVTFFQYPTERHAVEEAERAARAALGDDGYAAAFSTTTDLSVEEAVEFGLSAL